VRITNDTYPTLQIRWGQLDIVLRSGGRRSFTAYSAAAATAAEIEDERKEQSLETPTAFIAVVVVVIIAIRQRRCCRTRYC
jgi:hypothetical protein